jgi:hypothetical protein
MKTHSSCHSHRDSGGRRVGAPVLWAALMSACLITSSVRAYPPAPHHLFYGVVRDELGNPLPSEDAVVIFESASVTQVTSPVEGGLAPGTNYRLEVPMDAGITAERYKPSAMRPTTPFVLRVQIGSQVYLPIELVGDLSEMGEPGKSTRLDLTLGEDSDGDGLPDAWERQLIQSLGDLNSLSDVNAGDDSDGDGLSNLDEYISGNYAYDDKDGFSLKLKRVEEGMAVLEFLALRGRSYRVVSSDDLENWKPVEFGFVDDEAGNQYDVYQSDQIEKVEIAISKSADEAIGRYFKLEVE